MKARLDKEDGPSLRSAFSKCVELHSERTALVLPDKAIDYGTLDRRARSWASLILDRSHPHSPPQRVGVLGARNEVTYVGTLAALYAGAAFVPLNPKFPLTRTKAMIEAAQLDVIVCDRASFEAAIPALEGRHQVVIPEEEPTSISSEPPPLGPDDIAYLLFTSGSTGTPKGVPIQHAQALSFLASAQGRYGIQPSDRLSQTFDATFDLSIFDMFMAWHHGAALYPLGPLDLLAPGRFIERHALTVWFSVPSLAAMMVRKGTLQRIALPSLRWSLFCGEALPEACAQAWVRAAPNAELDNLYGPTEATIACLWYRYRAESGVRNIVPIGRPFPGHAVVLLDNEGQPTTEGVGELAISGPQLSPGYWRDAPRTAERFVTFEEFECRRFYRTGDRVERAPTGNYHFLGRVDHQVKIRGFRVELGEVEAALRSVSNSAQVAVVRTLEEDGLTDALVGFVERPDGDETKIRQKLRDLLPDYMVPRRIYFEAQLPLNANGKIDRKVLAEKAAKQP